MDIKAVGPDLVDDYFGLFDNAFTDNPAWADCYCAFYDDAGPDEAWDRTSPGFAERNRQSRRKTIQEGQAHGLLAYDGNKPVGWVNAGPRDSYRNLRIFSEAIEADDPPTGSIMCFVIHPEHRGAGVATALLESIEGYFQALGLHVSEGYPRLSPPEDPDFPWTAAYYKGSPAMFARAGYHVHKEFDRFVSVRKLL